MHSVLAGNLAHLGGRDALPRNPKVHGIAEATERRLPHVIGPLKSVAEFAVRVGSQVESLATSTVSVIEVSLLSVGPNTGHDRDAISDPRVGEERLQPCNEARM